MVIYVAKDSVRFEPYLASTLIRLEPNSLSFASYITIYIQSGRMDRVGQNVRRGVGQGRNHHNIYCNLVFHIFIIHYIYIYLVFHLLSSHNMRLLTYSVPQTAVHTVREASWSSDKRRSATVQRVAAANPQQASN